MTATGNKNAPATAPTVRGLGTGRGFPMQFQVSRTRALRASNLAMEGAALDMAAFRHLVNFDTPEADSLAEDILQLPVSDATKRRMLGRLRAFHRLNSRERTNYQELNGLLSTLAPVHVGNPLVRGFTVRDVVDAVKRPLGVLADERAGRPVTESEVSAARRLVDEIVRTVPRDVLLAPSMPHQLRGRRFAELRAAVEQHDRKAAA